MTEKTLTIIDAYGFLFRAYYVLPHLTTSYGLPVGGLYGFINILLKFISAKNTDFLVVVFDTGEKNFRHDIYSEYKINRPKPPEDLIPQFSLLREAVKAFNIAYEEVKGYEADDVIATLSKIYGVSSSLKVNIITADKDLLQLINDRVTIYDPIKNKYLTEEYVQEKFGTSSTKLLDLLSLTGDASDNVPGVPGIGVKTAAKLISEFHSLENLLSNAHEIKQNKCREALIKYKDQAFLSKKLVSLCSDVNISSTLNDYAVKLPIIDDLSAFLNKYEFKSLVSRVEKYFQFSTEELNKTNDLIKQNYSQERLVKFLNHCLYEGIVAVYMTVIDSIVSSISLSYSDNSLFYIDQNNVVNALKVIEPILAKNSILKVMYNVKGLMKIFPKMAAVDDIMVMSYSLDTGLHNHTLENIIFHNLKEEINQPSSRTLLHLHKVLKARLFENKLLTIYERFDKLLVNVIYHIEREGILIDVNVLQKLSLKFSERIKSAENKIYQLAGQEFNVGSPKQLSDILFNQMNIEQTKKLKSGIYSTSADVLEELSSSGVEIATEVLYWRHFNKLKNTYTDSLPKQIDSNTGRIHTFYSMTSTTTGRLSSSNPNLQNIPIRSMEGNAIRGAFIAKEGYKIISADYSQIELKLLAHIADVQAFKDAFSQKKDIHEITARQIFGGLVLDKSLRRKAKSINFGIIYGISAFGLAKQLSISRVEASKYIDYYFSCYPEIKSYMEEIKSYVRTNGYAKTIFGRRCFIKEINSKNPTLRGFAERAAINAPLQGTAADIIKRAMIKLFDEVESKAKIILQVHDELLIEVSESNVDDVVKISREVMENVVNLSVPLTVDISVGNDWANMVPISQ